MFFIVRVCQRYNLCLAFTSININIDVDVLKKKKTTKIGATQLKPLAHRDQCKNVLPLRKKKKKCRGVFVPALAIM